MSQAIRIPMAPPDDAWHDRLLEGLASLEAIGHLLMGGRRVVLCIFCQVPLRGVPTHHWCIGDRLVDWGGSPLLELPDGQRLPLVSDRRLVICDDCVRIIAPPGSIPLVVSCVKCQALILIPNQAVEDNRSVVRREVRIADDWWTAYEYLDSYMCLRCLQEVTEQARSFPHRTSYEYRAESPEKDATRCTYYIINREPQAFPVVYDSEPNEVTGA